MAAKKLIDYISDKNIKYLSIIGLAKNAGKTVTFNNIVQEARDRELKLALISYGRDGEKRDAITRQKKPRIFVPPRHVFATAEKVYYSSNLQGTLVSHTGYTTLLGEVNLYQAGQDGGYVELIGINSSEKLKNLERLIPRDIDLVVIDGAIDRRSSAVPTLAEGVILATGAVIGNREDLVVDRTLREVNKLTLKQCTDKYLLQQADELFSVGKTGLILKDNTLLPLHSRTSLTSNKELREVSSQLEDGTLQAIILGGALVNSFVEELILGLKIKECQLIVRDGTRVFLNQRNLNLLKKNQIELRVIKAIQLLAVTVNPVSPYGVKLNSSRIVNKLRELLIDIPVYDVLSEEYYH